MSGTSPIDGEDDAVDKAGLRGEEEGDGLGHFRARATSPRDNGRADLPGTGRRRMGDAVLGNDTGTQTTKAGTDATYLEVHHVH